MNENDSLWNLFNKAQNNGPGPKDDSALELAAGAAQIFAFYAALVSAGFNEEQAMQLTVGALYSQ